MSIADPAAYKAFDDRKPAAYCRRSKRSTEVCLEQVSVFGIFVISALGFSPPLPLGVVGHEVSTGARLSQWFAVRRAVESISRLPGKDSDTPQQRSK